MQKYEVAIHVLKRSQTYKLATKVVVKSIEESTWDEFKDFASPNRVRLLCFCNGL